jgi:ComF family protein
MALNKEFLTYGAYGRMMTQGLWKRMIDMIFPVLCINCGREDEFLCGECLNNIDLQTEQVCPICYKNGSDDGLVCKNCKEKASVSNLDGLIAVGKYTKNSVLNRAIHTYKYEFIKDLSVPLSKLMSVFFASKINGRFNDFTVTSVPLHKKRELWRGFNQAKMLADIFAEESKLPYADLLARTRFHTPQMELEKEKRLINVRDAFLSVRDIVPEKVLIIDDVATTLATLNSCAGALKKCGAKTVLGLVLARVY